MPENLTKHILATLAYYDVMDYPLTAFEVHKYLTQTNNSQLTTHNEKSSLLDVLNGLENEKLRKFVEEYQGFYFLKGQQGLVGQRLERNKIAESKYKILLRTAKWLCFVPHIQ